MKLFLIFLAGAFVGEICGIFTVALCTVAKGNKTDKDDYNG